MAAAVAGFLVVRRLGHVDPVAPGEIDVSPAQLGEVFYGGVFRSPWHEVHCHYYRRTLPPLLMEHARAIKEANHSYLGLEVCQDLDVAMTLLDFTRSFV